MHPITRKRMRDNREEQPHPIPDQASTGHLGPVLRGRGWPDRLGRTSATKDRIDQLVDDVGKMYQEMRDLMVLLVDQR